MTGIKKNEITDINDKKHRQHKLNITEKERWKISDAPGVGNQSLDSSSQLAKYLQIKQTNKIKDHV